MMRGYHQQLVEHYKLNDVVKEFKPLAGEIVEHLAALSDLYIKAYGQIPELETFVYECLIPMIRPHERIGIYLNANASDKQKDLVLIALSRQIVDEGRKILKKEGKLHE